jgi:hypothetical protein
MCVICFVYTLRGEGECWLVHVVDDLSVYVRFSEHRVRWLVGDTTRQNHYTNFSPKKCSKKLHMGSLVSLPRDLKAHQKFLDFTRHSKNCLALFYKINFDIAILNHLVLETLIITQSIWYKSMLLNWIKYIFNYMSKRKKKITFNHINQFIFTRFYYIYCKRKWMNIVE